MTTETANKRKAAGIKAYHAAIKKIMKDRGCDRKEAKEIHKLGRGLPVETPEETQAADTMAECFEAMRLAVNLVSLVGHKEAMNAVARADGLINVIKLDSKGS